MTPSRSIVSSGIVYMAYRDARQQLNLDAGIGYINEQRVSGDDVSSALALFGAAYALKFSDTAEFKNDFRFTTLFDDAANWRVANIAALTATMTELLSLKVSHTSRVANRPPPGFEKVDTIAAVALVAKF